MHENNIIKLSVLVISYNQEKYIRQTLDSILTQEHPYTYEVIVCDDASQDTTPQIVAEYAARHTEIVPVLREKNIGLIANYFDAVSRCRGEYIMVCAGDDYWLPGKVAKQVEFMDQHPKVGLCHGDAVVINSENEELSIHESKKNNTFEDFLRGNAVPACSMCVRSEILNKYISDINPLSKEWIMEDYPQLLWVAYNSKIVRIPGEVVAYRMLEESESHSKSITKLRKFAENVISIKKYYMNRYNFEDINENIALSNYFTLMHYIDYADDDYRNLCLKQLQAITKLNPLKRFCYKLRVISPQFERFYKWVFSLVFHMKAKLSSIEDSRTKNNFF